MKLLVLFSFKVSLKDWHNLGILSREISLYKKINEGNNLISFLTYGNKEDLRYKELLDDIKIFPASYQIKSKNRITQLLKSFLLPIKFRNLFKNIDIIRTNQISGSWIAWLAKLFYRKKLIIRGGYEFLRNYISTKKIQGHAGSLSYCLRYLYNYILEFVTYRLADDIILANKTDIEFIIKRFKLKYKIKRIHLVSNFIDTDAFKPISMEKKEKHVLFIGRLIQIKNLMNTFLAFRKIRDYTLDIIGDGPLIGKLRNKAKQFNIKVNFVGVISNEELPNMINQYYVFILPSFFEGNPKVLLEAMSCGLACIGTNVRGINNILQHKKNGYICETDPDSLANAIKFVYENKVLRDNLGIEARKEIIKNCSLNQIAKKEIQIYKNLLKK